MPYPDDEQDRTSPTSPGASLSDRTGLEVELSVALLGGFLAARRYMRRRLPHGQRRDQGFANWFDAYRRYVDPVLRAQSTGLAATLPPDPTLAEIMAGNEPDALERARTYLDRTARTEATRLHNERILSRMVREGHGSKRWVAVRDSRTRPSHAAANGQVQPLGGSFLVGGYAMLYPGDRSAPPSETENCRCTLVAVGARDSAALPALR